MLSTSSIPITPTMIVAASSLAEKAQAEHLWPETLRLRNQGKAVIFFPHATGIRLGSYHLRAMADSLSASVSTDVYIHFDVGKLAYRIGQVLDDVDRQTVSPQIFVYKAKLKDGDDTRADLVTHASSGINPASAASPRNLVPSEQKPTKIPKPRNMWILYRQEKHDMVLAENPGLHTSKISTIISAMWRGESVEVKAHYQKLAEQEKLRHALQYPDYKCSPRKSSEIKKRKRTSKEATVSIEGAMPTVDFSPRPDIGFLGDAHQPAKKRRVNNQPHTTETLSFADNQNLALRSLSPSAESIQWQPFPLFGAEESVGVYSQPPEELFFDTGVMQRVDWDANDAMLDWLL